MGRTYWHKSLADEMAKPGVTDRFYRFGTDTYEAFVCLNLSSHSGRLPVVKLAVRVLKDRRKEAIWRPLATYPVAHQDRALSDGHIVADRLKLSLIYADADGVWHTLSDVDTGEITEPFGGTI